jgi:hypothetical protein
MTCIVPGVLIICVLPVPVPRQRIRRAVPANTLTSGSPTGL